MAVDPVNKLKALYSELDHRSMVCKRVEQFSTLNLVTEAWSVNKLKALYSKLDHRSMVYEQVEDFTS